MEFRNRTAELETLERWWARPGASMGLLWGRRRVGKTALLQQFASGRRTVFHTGTGRPTADELRTLSQVAARLVEGRAGGFEFPSEFPLASNLRNLRSRPFTDWVDALETFAQAAVDEPLLLVLDEFPELVRSEPALPGILRATWDRIRDRTKLRALVSGSAVRAMAAMQEQRAPLYGRFDLTLAVHPFRPHEAALMLPRLSPADRALVWGLVGGIPLYLEWWDEGRSIRQNVAELALTPSGRLLIEGQHVLSTDIDAGDLGRRVLHAIAAGRTQYEEIKSAAGAEPARTLERLVELRLIERLLPVTEDPRRTRRRSYRIADNFLAFFLGVLDPFRAEIERGLGKTILPAVMAQLDDFMGSRWEDAFRTHLRRIAAEGSLGEEIVAIGPFWTTGGPKPVEIDAVALAGRARRPVLAGEAKWRRVVDGRRVRRELEQKAEALPRRVPSLRHAIAARDAVEGAESDVLTITAADIFDT